MPIGHYVATTHPLGRASTSDFSAECEVIYTDLDENLYSSGDAIHVSILAHAAQSSSSISHGTFLLLPQRGLR